MNQDPSSPASAITPLSSLLHEIKPPHGQPAARSFLLFDWMVTPTLIRVVYILGSLWWIVESLRVMFRRDPAAEQFASVMGQSAPSQFWNGLLMLVVGLVVLRVTCESMIVLYRLHDDVRAIRHRPAP